MASLVLGAFNMIATDGTSSVQADGTSWGEPVPIEAVINSALQDVQLVVIQGHSNREFPVRVRFYGTDIATLNAKEAALFGELEKPNTLTWTPDNGGPATVFDVVTSRLKGEDEAFVGEVQPKPWRTYVVQIVAAAFTRSATETVTASLPATGSTTTLLDACTLATGWTGTIDGAAVTPGAPGTAVTLTGTVAKGSHTYVLQKTFAATTSATKYLAIIWTPPVGKRLSTMKVTGDGVDLPLIAEVPSGVAGNVKSYFYVAAATLALTRVQWSGYADDPGSAVLSLDNLDVTDIKPIFGTGRQQLRSLMVGGAARTPATLAVESATAALGDAMIYVWDADDATIAYSPPLRQFRSSGNTVNPDAAQVSGSTEAINATADNFQVPVGLWPRSTYLLVARLKSTAGGVAAITIDTKTIVGANAIGATSKTVNVTTTTSYAIVAIDEFQLPTTDVPLNSTALMQIGLTTGVSPAVTYDELWLLGAFGNLIRVDCGTGAGTVGGSARRLFIKPASIATPRNRILIGHSADGSDSFFPVGSVTSWGFPRFKGGSKSNVLAVTPGATDATLSLSHFKSWPTNAAS